MIANELGQQLHDRATKGESLSAEEQMQLEQWYSHLDLLEGEIINRTAPSDPIFKLQEKIDVTLAGLLAVTKRIQEIAAENDCLRREIATLQQQLAQLSTSQLA